MTWVDFSWGLILPFLMKNIEKEIIFGVEIFYGS